MTAGHNTVQVRKAPFCMPRRLIGGASVQKAAKGDIAAASKRNAARQPKGPATTPPNMYPCTQSDCSKPQELVI
jgi:hypothetical protein